jgi:small subunit ribosomal protein S16
VRIADMSVKIRLTRKGAKKRPFYRIVAADSEAPRDGRFLEVVGHYNPLTDPAQITVDEEKLNKWVERGAKISETVRSLLRKKEVSEVSSNTS